MSTGLEDSSMDIVAVNLESQDVASSMQQPHDLLHAANALLPYPTPNLLPGQSSVTFWDGRTRPKNGCARKFSSEPSRFQYLPNDFEFAPWGSVTHIDFTDDDRKAGDHGLQEIRRQSVLGQFTASALAGNAVLGSVFYALPAVVAVSSVYSPISFFIATLMLFLWRPIMEELGSALPMSGAPYTYMLNVSSKSFALLGAALLLLDYTSTSVVSAATAASYLAGEVKLPFKDYVVTILVLLVFTVVSLSGVKESARIALAVLSFHMGTMVVLSVVSCIHWGKNGSQQLTENWKTAASSSGSSIPRQIFN
ncbi:hypothetical protein H0H93_011623, partial [Arthromyces matolae]